MANQYVAFCESDARGEMPETPTWYFLPVTGKLQPDFTVKDEPRKEFRGGDTALGDTTVVRRESAWKWTLECAWYPGIETAILMKHALGKAGTRSVVDTSAYKGIMYPVAMPYGTGLPLGDRALFFAINTDEEGVTKSQIFGGGRTTGVTITGKGTDDIKLSFDFNGAGAWIGTPDQTAIAGVTWPECTTPFCTSDALFYIGGTPTRTGVAPDFTALAAGTALPFRPDDFTIKITNGLEDVIKMNGIKGPSVTRRTKQFTVSFESTMDYSDPSSGEFSSADEYKRVFTAPATNNILMVLDNKVLAGAATENYKAVMDLPYLLAKVDTPERGTEGKTPSVKASYTSLFDSTCKYPVALLLTDKETTYQP